MEYKTAAELDAESLEELSREALVTNLTPGSRSRATIQIINRRLGRKYSVLRFNTAMGFLSSSSGAFLDLLGAIVGIPRRTAIAAIVDRDDEAIKFYVAAGTLVTALPAGVIPVGTLIQSESGSVQFQVTEEEPFDDVTDHVYVSAVALEAGASSRVGKNVLREHSLGIAAVLVTNVKNISSGEDTESDDNYRYRISNSRAVNESANLTAVRIAMLPVPGVSDIILMEYPGYIDALIIPSGNTVQESIVRACQFLGDREKAAGIRLACRGPGMVPYEVYVQANMTKETPVSDRDALRVAVQDAVLDYFDDIPIGGTMVVRQLESRIQTSDARLYDHRLICFNARRRPQLLRNFPLRKDELFMPDPEAENAVLVTVT